MPKTYGEQKAFMERYLARQGVFSSDARDAYWRAAKQMVEANPALRLVIKPDQTMTGLPVYAKFGKHIGWGGRKTFRGGWELRTKEYHDARS